MKRKFHVQLFGEESPVKGLPTRLHATASHGYEQVYGHFQDLGNPQQEDFIDILEKNGQRYGIVTMGDYVTGQNRGVKNLLQELEKHKCDKAICAFTESKPKIEDAILAYEIYTIIKKSITNDTSKQRIINNFDAQLILDTVQKAKI